MMKTILYILIALMVGSNLLTFIPQKKPNPEVVVYLQCSEKYPEKESMTESIQIIKSRLTDAEVNVNIKEEENSIRLEFMAASDYDKVKSLLTAKGRFSFHETLDRKEILPRIRTRDSILSALNMGEHSTGRSVDRFDPVLGDAMESDRSGIIRYLNSLDGLESIDSALQFAWSYLPGEYRQYELFLIRKDAFLGGNHIVAAHGNGASKKSPEINFSFDEEGTRIWSEYTKRNVNRAVAFVLDGAVYFCPVVREQISGGKCAITGNFTASEVRNVVALMNHGELPLEFTIKE